MSDLDTSPSSAIETASNARSEVKERWWHRATGYQVYPRSFADSNGDGVGDIPGIISRLGHLSDLGVGFIWLSPVYASPMIDNGYDISDYRDIAHEFGTLDDMDHLISAAADRGIGIVMDLVVNHTSSLHAWFQAARASRDVPEHDFYIWRDPAPDGGPPDDARAYFGGPAWTYVEEIGQYYFHFFSPAQPDLNWQNADMRAEIYDMMRWWLDRGIAGFRMDVIDLIGKDIDAQVYEEGPDLHRFIQEMHREVLAGRDILTVGETWSASTETGLLYCGRDRKEIDMVFEFSHIRDGWHPELGKFAAHPFNLITFKRSVFAWQDLIRDDGWHALFLSNHDLPRQVSYYANDGEHRRASAKMLATVMHLLKGTPFIYQGEEIGMTNAKFERIDQYRDLDTLNHFEEQVALGMPPETFIAGANRNSRDNARTPMQWNSAPHGGFTTGTPWIEANPNAHEINVEQDLIHPDSVFAHYRQLVQIRKDHDVVPYGHTTALLERDPHIMAYQRKLDGQTLLVVGNFSADPQKPNLPEEVCGVGKCLICSHEDRSRIDPGLELAPYESFAILMT